MKIIIEPNEALQQELIKRPSKEFRNLELLTEEVFRGVMKGGDKAIQKYTERFDGIKIASSKVPEEKIKHAGKLIPDNLKNAINTAKENITRFHETQQDPTKKIETTPGVVCWRESRPLDRVGIYIPGGTAPLFSTVLMLAIPARLAGCKQIILCSPPDTQGNIHPAILYAAEVTGVSDIFAVGGIQAIAGMTLGTESIPRVDKIFGPGNAYVTAGKLKAQQYGTAIDLPAGPSELLIIADESSVPEFVAADLLSQAEHGPDSQVLLVTDSVITAEAVLKEVKKQKSELPRKEIAEEALKNSRMLVFNDLKKGLDFSNLYAPEHLILAVRNAEKTAKRVTNAGSVFLGNYSCESAGDYASGTNHTLPTSGFARSYSGVSLDSFVKKITFQKISKKGLQNLGSAIEIMAEAEELMAHKNAVTVRLKNNAS